jgi:hypothetical protein
VTGGTPPPEGASNLQPVLRHTGIVSAAQHWSTGDRLYGGDAHVAVTPKC